MFCSNCGKTMPAEGKKCPFCQLEVKETRFIGLPFTSCQPVQHPGDEYVTGGRYANVTRTIYTGNGETESDGAYEQTTYRAAFTPEDGYAADGMTDEAETIEPGDEPVEETGDVELTDESLNAVQEGRILTDNLRIGEIDTDDRPAGISDNVRKYMEELAKEDNRSRGLFRRKSRDDEEEDEEETEEEDTAEEKKPGLFAAFGRRRDDPEEDEEADEDKGSAGGGTGSEPEEDEDGKETAAEEETADTEGAGKPEDGETAKAAESAGDDDDDTYIPRSRRSGEKPVQKTAKKKKSHKKAKGIIRTVAVALLIIAVLAGVIIGVSIMTKKSEKSPIPGVSLDLYNKGCEVIKSHVTADYKKECMALYASNMLDFTAKLESDKTAVTSLKGETEDVYDAQFVEALTTIQTNINNALTMDALATGETNADKQAQAIADSNQRWLTINESVDGLLNATTTVEIEAIIRGEKIEIPKETPKPTATPVVYTTLSKGMKVAAVTDLQLRLMELGYYDDEIDGAYGNKTVTAVKLFQSSANLEVTGTADPDTLAAVYAEDAPRTGSKVTPAPTDGPVAPAPEGNS